MFDVDTKIYFYSNNPPLFKRQFFEILFRQIPMYLIRDKLILGTEYNYSKIYNPTGKRRKIHRK